MALLGGLPSDYDMVRTVVENMSPLPTMEVVLPKLTTEEAKLKPTLGTRPRQGLRCVQPWRHQLQGPGGPGFDAASAADGNNGGVNNNNGRTNHGPGGDGGRARMPRAMIAIKRGTSSGRLPQAHGG